jgi:hypothetical protein
MSAGGAADGRHFGEVPARVNEASESRVAAALTVWVSKVNELANKGINRPGLDAASNLGRFNFRLLRIVLTVRR